MIFSYYLFLVFLQKSTLQGPKLSVKRQITGHFLMNNFYRFQIRYLWISSTCAMNLSNRIKNPTFVRLLKEITLTNTGTREKPDQIIYYYSFISDDIIFMQK